MQKRNKFEVDYTPSRWPFYVSQMLNVTAALLAIAYVGWPWKCFLLLLAIFFALQAWRSLHQSPIEQISFVDGLWYLKVKQRAQRRPAELAQVKVVGQEMLLLVFKLSESKMRLQRVYCGKDTLGPTELRALKRIINIT